MRQTRLSIGCRDWQAIIETIGPEAAGILLYLLSMMRSMQAAEVSIRISELAAALHLSDETAETALASTGGRIFDQISGYVRRDHAAIRRRRKAPERGAPETCSTSLVKIPRIVHRTVRRYIF